MIEKIFYRNGDYNLFHELITGRGSLRAASWIFSLLFLERCLISTSVNVFSFHSILLSNLEKFSPPHPFSYTLHLGWYQNFSISRSWGQFGGFHSFLRTFPVGLQDTQDVSSKMTTRANQAKTRVTCIVCLEHSTLFTFS